MNIEKYLKLAGVSNVITREYAVRNLEEAERKARGLLWHKIVARLVKAGKLAKVVFENKAARASDVDPSLRKYDIEPVRNINAFGDNAGWGDNGPLNATPFDLVPGTPEYDNEVKRNYWNKGEFTGTLDSIKAWYRRNGGACEAYDRGLPIQPSTAQKWEANGVTVMYCSGAWFISTTDKWLGFIPVKVRIGYEIGNAVNVEKKTPNWVSFDGETLKAPLTWSVMPGK